MKKLFISQPMRGKSDEEILSERRAAVVKAKTALGEEVEVIDTFFGHGNFTPLECLGKSIAMLSEADIAVFASGWETARGCKIEHTCAEEYGVKLLEL